MTMAPSVMPSPMMALRLRLRSVTSCPSFLAPGRRGRRRLLRGRQRLEEGVQARSLRRRARLGVDGDDAEVLARSRGQRGAGLAEERIAPLGVVSADVVVVGADA